MSEQELQNINNSNIEVIETLKNEADDAIQINKDLNNPINPDLNIPIETDTELKSNSILKPKKPRTEKQILAFQKATQIRLSNLEERTKLKQIENEKLRIETEAKIIKKAKALERKQLKAKKIIDEALIESEEEEEKEDVKCVIEKVKEVIKPVESIKEEIKEPQYNFIMLKKRIKKVNILYYNAISR